MITHNVNIEPVLEEVSDNSINFSNDNESK